MINIEAIFHEPKSRFAYAYDVNTLHIRIQTKKDNVEKIDLIWGDPFEWVKNEEINKWVNYKTAMIKEYSTEYHDHWFIEIKSDLKRTKYGFHLIGENEIFYGTRKTTNMPEDTSDLFNYFNFPYICESDIFTSPKWIKDTTWYHIFLDRFYTDQPLLDWNITEVRNNMIFGGDINGVIKKLDYLEDLGINGIYFNPIFESPSAHKYDTTDYYKIDPSFGTNDDFKKLVSEAHKRGMKVMLDAVFGHAGWNHPYWQDVVENGLKSKYADYFIIFKEPVINFELHNGEPRSHSKDINYATFAFVKKMPKWNTENPKVRRYLFDIAKYWIEEYNIDAWRYDVSDEISHNFWIELSKELNKIKPDLYQLGENWHNANAWLIHNQFNGVMNYELLFPIWDYFSDKIDTIEFVNTINKVLTMYPKNILETMYTLVDSHDTNRIKNLVKDQVKLAYLFLFSFTGQPAIYYGSEVGLDGGQDPDNRRPMLWENQDIELRDHIKKLIKLKDFSATKAVDINWINVDDTLIYSKEENEKIFFIINKDTKIITLPKEMQNITVYDYFLEKDIRLEKSIHLNNNDYKVYILKEV
ncbi:glycoside hydrolase family 13 protein [Mycoplasmatota bacterium WC44]